MVNVVPASKKRPGVELGTGNGQEGQMPGIPKALTGG